MTTNALNLRELNQEEAINLCRFYMRSNQNMLMLGQRGIGKTHIAIQSAIDCGFKLNYINLSVLERPDLAGFPIINDNSDIVHYKSPYYLPTLKDNQKSDAVILFDEVDKCNQELTAPLLEILQFKRVNGKPINCVACVLTGNLMNEGAFSNSISTALLDRGAKYILSFNFEIWKKWATEHNIHPLILGFLTSHQNMAIGEAETTELASASPRGWEYVSDSLIKATEYKITDIDTITAIVAGFVGQTVSLQFAEWYSYSRQLEKYILPLIENGFCDIDYHKLEPTEQLVFAIMACYIAKNKVLEKTGKKRLKHLDYLCRFFIDVDVPKEIQQIAMSGAFGGDLVIKEKLYECKPFLTLHSELMNSAK